MGAVFQQRLCFHALRCTKECQNWSTNNSNSVWFAHWKQALVLLCYWSKRGTKSYRQILRAVQSSLDHLVCLFGLAVRMLWPTCAMRKPQLQVSSCVRWPSHLIIQSHQACQAWCALCMSVLAAPNEILVLHVPGSGLQEDLPLNFPVNRY